MYAHFRRDFRTLSTPLRPKNWKRTLLTGLAMLSPGHNSLPRRGLALVKIGRCLSFGVIE